MAYMTNTINAKTSFNFGEMANETNLWDSSKVHPMNHEIEIISHNGKIVTLRLAQVATIIAIVNRFENTGKAIDYLFEGLDDKQSAISEICREF